jgi:uncharacterized integral membrane protein
LLPSSQLAEASNDHPIAVMRAMLWQQAVGSDGHHRPDDRARLGHRSGVRSARQRSRTIAATALGVLLILVGALNSQSVRIHWIVATTHAPLIIVILGCGGIGFVVCWLVARHRARPKRG